MNYKDDCDIMKLINHIKNINQEMANPSIRIRYVLENIKNDLPVQSRIYEISSVNMDKSKLTSIDNIDINILYQKLPAYKVMCEAELINKLGKNQYDSIKKEENL